MIVTNLRNYKSSFGTNSKIIDINFILTNLTLTLQPKRPSDSNLKLVGVNPADNRCSVKDVLFSTQHKQK